MYPAFFLPSYFSNAQLITTVAGKGIAGYTGDGISATATEFNPGDVVLDASGNLLVADAFNNRVRIIDAAGTAHTFAGTGISGYSGDGGPATNATFNSPQGVKFDNYGNLIIIDENNYCIRKINTAGIITTIAGNGAAGFSGDGGPATNANLNSISGFAIDVAGNIYIATDNRRIRKIDVYGIITTIAGTAIAGYYGDGGPATDAQLKGDRGVAIDPGGNIYFADMQNDRIRKIDGAGIITTVAGTGIRGFSADGTPAMSAQLSYPSATFFDGAGNLYFSDINNARLRMVDAAGILHTIAGNGTHGSSGDGGPATAAEVGFACPGVFDCAGNLYFADIYNNRVRMIAYNHAPVMAGGASQSITVCADTLLAPVSYLLTATDTDAGQPISWDIITAPVHGTAAGAYSATATGGPVTPTGFTYTPASGYTGPDSFSVTVSDCKASYTTTIHALVNSCALAAAQPPAAGREVLSIMPNPCTTFFDCSFYAPTNEEVSLTIRNVTGTIIKECTIKANATQRVLLHVPAGVYFITAATKASLYNSRLVVTE